MSTLSEVVKNINFVHPSWMFMFIATFRHFFQTRHRFLSFKIVRKFTQERGTEYVMSSITWWNEVLRSFPVVFTRRLVSAAGVKDDRVCVRDSGALREHHRLSSWRSNWTLDHYRDLCQTLSPCIPL